MPIEQQQLRREIRNRTAGDGIGSALHEMRDGLTVIHAYAQLLQHRIRLRQAIDPEATLVRLAIIERTSMRMEHRLRQLEHHHSEDR